MTDFLIQYLEAAALLAPTWGLLLVLVFMTVESSFIPFPSEVVMIPAGFLAARGAMATAVPELDAFLAVVAGIGGSLLGALVNYGLAVALGTPFLERYGRYILLPPPKLRRAEQLFRRYGAGATFFCRLLPAIRQLISLPAGLARMPLGSFCLWTGLGAGIWVAVLTGIGFAIGTHTTDMSYADLVHQGKAMASANLIWLVPLCLLGMVAYVAVSNRIMRVEEA
jgi:membrane protein DedA with SNARE-associated domain